MQIQQNYFLKRYNTFGLNVYTKYCAEFNSMEELKELLGINKNISPKMILGGGSNILFTRNYDGIILKNNIAEIEVINEDQDFVYVKVGAGVNWHWFVMYCVNNNYFGVENLSLIPGNIGASPMQNIGAYGVEIKDVFYQLEAFHLHEKSIQKFSSNDCGFGYRESVFKKKFKDQFAILNVTYCLKKNPVYNISYGAVEEELQKMNVEKLSLKSVSDAVIHIRTSKLPDPKIIGNAGSFFKNPVITKHEFQEIQKQQQLKIPFYKMDEDHFKIPAGWLIEQCGWKGYRNGDAGCYDKQALVVVNYGNASGKEIFELSVQIQSSIIQKFGITLETEVNIIG